MMSRFEGDDGIQLGEEPFTAGNLALGSTGQSREGPPFSNAFFS